MTRSFEDSLGGDNARRSSRLHGTGDKAAVYARFIPREELGSFAAWSPRALSGAASEPVNSGVQRPAPPKPQAPEQPQQDMAALLRASRQAGYQDGYRDGLVALEAFKQSFMTQMMGQFGSLTGTFQSQLDEVQQQMSHALVRTATQIARQVVRSELSTRPELIVGVAQEALGVLLTSARHITVRVHPEDMAVVAQGAAEALDARGARLVADHSVTRGGCMVESDLGVIEANVETRWRRAAEQLGNREAYEEPPSAASLADVVDLPSHSQASEAGQ
jgi:flagellar assembly protein FliH